MPGEVDLEPLLEILSTQVGVDEPDDARALAVRDEVEDLLHLLRMSDGHLDGMGALKPVELERGALVSVDELVPEVPLWEDEVCREVLHPGGEALVEPEVIPPRHGHQ